MKIINPGPIRLSENPVGILKQSDDIALVAIDLLTKYAECSVGEGSDGSISVYYYKVEETIRAGDGDDMTMLELDEFRGWKVFTYSHSRYTTYITLYKD